MGNLQKKKFINLIFKLNRQSVKKYRYPTTFNSYNSYIIDN